MSQAKIIANSLTLEMKNRIQKKMETVGHQYIIDTIKDTITKEVYDAYTPEGYNRTYQLRESIGLKKSVITPMELSYTYGHRDGFQGSYSPLENPPMGRAYNIFNSGVADKGDDISKELPWIIHEGLSYPLMTDNEKWIKPKPYMNVARNKISENIINVLKR